MTSPQAAYPQKTVHRMLRDSEINSLCFDEATRALRPNLVLVDSDGSVVFEINELGLKGVARDPARKLAVVWGDSVVFGVRWSWPCLLDGFAPGYQFLNGGVEADPYQNVLRRAADFNRAHDVALHIVMLGWHPIVPPPGLSAGDRRPAAPGRLSTILRGLRPASPPLLDDKENRQVRDDLRDFLRSTPNTVLLTMPTALNRRIVDRNLSGYFTDGNRDTVFRFAADAPYSRLAQRYLFDHIIARNAAVREAAEANGVRLVDLAAAFDTTPLADFRQHFFDVLHLRVRAYPMAAALIHEGIKDLLR